MSKDQSIIERCTGLNIVHDPLQTPEGIEANTSDLAVAVDVVISDSLKVESADGFTLKRAATLCHSGFCDGGDALVCDGTSLYQLGTDYTLTGKRSGMSGDQLDYAQYGNAIYYTNGTQNGIFHGGASWPWNVDTYNAGETFKYFAPTVPVFNHIEVHHGYMLGSIDNALYASELGRFGLWHMKSPAMLPSKILMIKHVEQGCFVSDEKKIYFFKGLDPHQFSVGDPVSPYPVYEWADCIDYIQGTEVKGYETPGMCAIFNCKEGLCLGTPDGQLLNLTRKKIINPDTGAAGASLLRGFNIIYTVR